MTAEILSLLMFGSTCLVLLLGYPVAFTLGGMALVFAGIGVLTGDFRFSLLNALPSRYFGIMTKEILVAVPLFVFMGLMLERAKIAETLLSTMAECFGRIRGGMGFSVIVVGMLLAASTGIVGATVVTMGLLSLMPMIRAGYDPKLATGVICASGTLGQIIPPSIVLVLLGDVLQGAHAQAQRDAGMWGVEPVSVMELFSGAFVPGLLLVILYMAWLGFQAMLYPHKAPAVQTGAGDTQIFSKVMRAMLPPLVLVLSVLGAILTGVATPTEAAAVGAMGAIVLSMIYKKFNRDVLTDAMRETVKITSMVFVILMGASIFSLVFRGLEGDALIERLLSDLPGGVMGAMLCVMIVMFLMGFFLDFIEITFVVVPIVAPVLLQMGVDPVWLGVMIAINLQTSFLTPPFGFALFYLRGVAPDSIPTKTIYQGVLPFVGLQIAMLVILSLYPALVTTLPKLLFP